MAETKQEETKKPLKLSRPGRLELKKTVESGVVKQSFSHGRSKAVAVEVKKKRTFKPGEGGRMAEVKEPVDGKFAGEDAAADGSTLSEAERQARARALDAAKQAGGPTATPQEIAEAVAEVFPETEAAAEAPADGPAEQPAETVEAAEAEAPPSEAAPETQGGDQSADARAEADRVARELAEKELGQIGIKPSAKVPPRPAQPATPTPSEPTVEEEERSDAKQKRRGDAKRTPARSKTEPRRREGKLTITQALEVGDAGLERQRSEAAVRRRRERERQRQREISQAPTEYKKMSREIVVPESITVQELANRMAEKGAEVIKALMKMGVMVTINQTVDADTAELIVTEFGHKIRRVSEADVEMGIEGMPDDPGALEARPPVVTVMGHVDHGKTSLLDALRETDVVSREAGGITQHIGAYQVRMSSGDRITFIDTPGHAAFTEMRSRGANVTDIVILVVAADDGVQPQTIEAISHAKAAEAPLIVAINKIDAKGADAQRVRTELLQHDIQVEEMGGEVLAVEVSAKEKTGLDKLEEAIILQSEILELQANPNRAALGIVVEAQLERGRGPVATVLVQRGTLRVGDVFIAGAEWGRVRALIDDRGEQVEEAGPSTPVEVLGLNGAPGAGDEFAVVENEIKAREISEYRQRQIRKDAGAVRGSVEQMFSMIQAGEANELPVVVKADVQGSAEAIIGLIDGLATDEVNARILHTGVGAISESDVGLAKASGALIIAFNVRANQQARDLAQRDGVDIRYYSVIYEIADDLKAMLSGMLAPEIRETFLGYAEILEVFRVSKVGNVAGCRITEGVVRRGAGVRLLRDNVVIHTGTLATLKRFKDEVKEVNAGLECGMAFENYQDIKVGDQIECYEVEEVAREL